MKITKAIETPQGTIQFQGELNPDEVDFMVDWFLNSMLARGCLPFASMTEQTAANYVIENAKGTQQ